MNFNIFKRFKPETAVVLPSDDQAWSGDSHIYARDQFEKYNPDALIGRKGFAIYRRMMTDEQVKAVVKFKRDAITSRDYYFELNDDTIEPDEADRRIAIANKVIENMSGSWTDALNGVMSGIYNGFSITEKVFNSFEYNGQSFWGVERLRLKPFDTFSFWTDEFGNIIKLTQTVHGEEQELDLEKFIHFVVNPDVDEHYGQSELRECYRAWFSKDNVIKFRNIWLERHAGGFRSIKPTDGSSIPVGSKEYLQWQNILENMNGSTGLIMPANREVITDYPANNVAYKEAIEDCDMQIARALLVPNLIGISPQGDHGSLAQADSQVEVFMWTLQADADRLEDTINEQVFRMLGLANFGDDNWPKFRFKPMSSSKQQGIVDTWKELVGVNAVKPSPADEAHLRELVDFPAATDDGENGDDSILIEPLESGQITSMLDIISKVATGTLKKETAEEVLVTSFPITREKAQDLLKDVEEGSVEIPSMIPPGEDGAEGDDDNDPNTPAPTGGPEAEGGQGEQQEMHQDSTIVGKGSVSISAFERAMDRVDFAVIDKNSEDGIEENADSVASILGLMYDELLSRMADIPADRKLSKVRYDTKLTTKLRRAVRRSLKEGWKLGEKHAQAEIGKAKKESFKVNFERLKYVSTEYFEAKSFIITGNYSENTLQIIKNSVMNGIKNDWTLAETKVNIYEQLASAGYVAAGDVAGLLNLPADASPDAKINTITRTSTFEAINEARYSFFTDPALGGFVQALEYSSILDSRTTQVCKHLDGTTHHRDSEVWNQYRPPNHYNCRSLLIPVTSTDKWAEDELPTIQPQSGFGK